MYLKNDIRSRQTAPPAEADLHIDQVAFALGDVPDLSVTVTLREWIVYRERTERKNKTERRRHRNVSLIKGYFRYLIEICTYSNGVGGN